MACLIWRKANHVERHQSLTFVGTASGFFGFFGMAPGPPASCSQSESRVPSEAITTALVKRLRTSTDLSEEDIKAIQALPIRVKEYAAEQTVVRDGQRPTECCLIVDGFCLRSKTITSGRRQILSIHIAGEIPDLMSLYLEVMDHDLMTLTPCTLGFISHQAMRQLYRRQTNVGEIFWRDTLIDAAMFREWIVNVGQRPAPARLANVIVELRERLRAIGKVTGNSFDMPLTQEQIGEALGITGVHANRVIKQMRQDGILELSRGRVTVFDEFRLMELADFDNRYLHQSPAL
jgi:CRP-like cAMP-binding protein